MFLRNNYLPRFLLFTFLLTGLTSCHVARYIGWNFADISDSEKFPVDSITASTRPVTFSKAKNTELIGDEVFSFTEGLSLSVFLENHQTAAFLIIRDDTMVYEQYFGKYGRESVFPSFSIAKSFVSALVGIALGEGKFRSLEQPITDFLPELKDTLFRQVTLRDLLEMRSGIRFSESYGNPFGLTAKFYYGLNLKKYTLSLSMEELPGVRYNYQSANTELLAMALERATGTSLSKYLQEQIWDPMGAVFPATWSVDSRRHRQIKAFCCINGRAEDFARFGQLYLDIGMVDGDTVIPRSWIEESLTLRNDSKDSQGYPYTYHWRVTREGDFFAKGILGQYIYVSPAKRVVIYRAGKKSDRVIWPQFFRDLISRL